MKYTKTIIIGSAISIASLGVGYGGHALLDSLVLDAPIVEEVPSGLSVDLEIEEGQEGLPQTWRIVPSVVLDFFPQGSFTMNDIISEIEFEQRGNGESERYFKLVNLRGLVDQQMADKMSSPQPKNENI